MKQKKDLNDYDILTTPIDMYTHLCANTNIKTVECTCNDEYKKYCVNCKEMLCERCNKENHNEHVLISKNHTKLSWSDIEYLFKNVEESLVSNKILNSLVNIKSELIKSEKNQEKVLINTIKTNIDKKIANIENLFTDIEKSFVSTKEKIIEIKNMLYNFQYKYKDFLISDKENENFRFLVNFDMINIIKSKIYEIYTFQNQMEADINYYQEITYASHLNQNKTIQNLLDDSIKTFEKKYVFDNSEKISEHFKNIQKRDEQSFAFLNNKNKIYINSYLPDEHLFGLVQEMFSEHFIDIKQRISLYTKEIEKFKTKIFDYSNNLKTKKKVTKKFDLQDIVKEVNMYENNKSNEPQSLFTNRGMRNRSGEKRRNHVIRLTEVTTPICGKFSPNKNECKTEVILKNLSNRKIKNGRVSSINSLKTRSSGNCLSSSKEDKRKLLSDCKSKTNDRNNFNYYTAKKNYNNNTLLSASKIQKEKMSNYISNYNEILNDTNSKYSQSASSMNYFNYKNRDEVNLNNPLLRTLFYGMFLEVYKNNFTTETIDIQKSHGDLNLKQKFKNMKEKIKENSDITCKINENTNIIVLYNKKNNTMLKVKLNLSKNPYGYNGVFPTGCRTLVIDNKIYITGGKNERNQFKVFLVYDFLNKKLKRVTDMNYARSYHTMAYADCFNTIVVLGGENNSTNEVYDPYLNRWLPLPKLNSPRANCIFHFDKPNGLIYSIFGQEKKIIDSRYSSVIEYLDLTNIKNGFQKLNYQNSIGVNVKKDFSTFPLSNQLILCYSGKSITYKEKYIFVIDLDKKAVTYIDSSLAQKLKIDSMNNSTLSSIISKFELFN